MHEINQKIYIVDNDKAFQSSLAIMLQSVGYEVELFENGETFLELAQKGLSGCIILDVRLPSIGGLEIQRRLAKMGSVTPIIFITGHGDIKIAVKAMKAKAIDFLTKPIREQDVLDAISIAMQDFRKHEVEKQRHSDKLRRIKTLSPREQEIFDALCNGKLAKQIAHELKTSESTVKVHRRNLMSKLNVSSISHLILQYKIFKTETRIAA